MTGDPGLPLPAAVLARLRSADTLRAELAGITAERDALRTELDTAAWERDTAQNEAAFLREEVLGRDHWSGKAPDQLLGLLLTMGDTPPPPPADEHGQDVALVSLSTAAVYVRVRRTDQWTRYGDGVSYTDFATMAENGPWITVDAACLRDHQAKVDARRRLSRVLYDAGPGVAPWPDSTERLLEQARELSNHRVSARPDQAADWISVWHSIASSTQLAWADEKRRADATAAVLSEVPHPYTEDHTNRGACRYCGQAEDQQRHTTSTVPA